MVLHRLSARTAGLARPLAGTADHGGLRHAGQEYQIDRPELVDLDSIRGELPRFVGFASSRLGLRHFVRVRLADGEYAPRP